MKKITTILLSLILATSMVACSSPSSEAPATSSDTPAPEASAEASTEATVTFEDQLGAPGTLRVGMSPDYAPFDYYDENGELTGFDVDMANELAKYIGTEESPYPIEIIPMSFDTIISSLNTGVVDVGISGFTYDPDRDAAFSEPYLVSPQLIVVTKDGGITSEANLAGKTMAAGLGTVGADVIDELLVTYTDINHVNPGEYPVMFESLKGGAIHAVVCDEAVAKNYVAANDTLMILDGEYAVQNMSVITTKSNTVLMDKINEAVTAFVASDAYEELRTKYGV